MKIKLIDLKNKLEQDFGWENLMADNDNKWFVDNLLKDTIQAIGVIQCSTELCEHTGDETLHQGNGFVYKTCADCGEEI